MRHILLKRLIASSDAMHFFPKESYQIDHPVRLMAVTPMYFLCVSKRHKNKIAICTSIHAAHHCRGAKSHRTGCRDPMKHFWDLNIFSGNGLQIHVVACAVAVLAKTPRRVDRISDRTNICSNRKMRALSDLSRVAMFVHCTLQWASVPHWNGCNGITSGTATRRCGKRDLGASSSKLLARSQASANSTNNKRWPRSPRP